MQKHFSQPKSSSSFSISHVSSLLTLGARAELELTPKPGLVDRLDSGSHRDLTFEKMLTSVNLLPLYYEELAEAYLKGANVAGLRSVGLEAEKRMFRSCGSNTHKGYIFLSGLILLAAAGYDDIREGIIDLSASFFKAPLPESNGTEARKKYAVGGIAGECLNGLPSVYEHALPAILMEFALSANAERAKFAGLASLMQTVEDTTALHRCGTQGLEVIKEDGEQLALHLKTDTHKAWLTERNTYYKSINLTMGGVADLLAASLSILMLENGTINLIG